MNTKTMSQNFSPLTTCLFWMANGLFIFGVTFTSVALAKPYTPKDNAEVLEKLPAPGDATKRELRRLRIELSRDPENLDLATGMAERYINLGRAESDPRYFGYAQAALTPWWDLPEPPVAILILRATVFQNRHDFERALADLNKVLKTNPDNAQAWLTRAVILEVQGKYSQAMQSCMRLRNLAPTLVRVACLSSISGRNGRSQAGYNLLFNTLNKAPDAEPRIKLWALTILAEIANSLGQTERAEKHFLEADSLGIRDSYLLNAYADFLLDTNRPGEVKNLLADETRSDGALLRLALAEKRLNAPRLTEHVVLLNARFNESRMRGDRLHLREEARFTLHLLEKPGAALKLARENWSLQREPWDARLVLESALAANASKEAGAVLDWLNRTGIENPEIQKLVQRFNKEGS